MTDEAREIAGKLSEAQKRLLLAMEKSEHRAGDFGWISSNATVQMRAMNALHELIARRYRAGRNVYYPTPLGEAVRSVLMEERDNG